MAVLYAVAPDIATEPGHEKVLSLLRERANVCVVVATFANSTGLPICTSPLDFIRSLSVISPSPLLAAVSTLALV